jgi:hypothetical protein
MGDHRLNRDLERLHQSNTPDSAHRKLLEDDLLLRYRNIHSKKKRLISMLNPHTRFARFAVLGLTMLLLGVGACSTQTTTEVEIGKQVSVSLDGQITTPGGEKSIDINERIQEVMNQLSATDGIEEMDVNIEQDGEGNLTLGLMLFGDDIDGEALTAMLHDSFPEMPDAEILVEVLEGTIEESWAERFGREVFHFESDGGSDEEIRAQILQQIQEQGFEGEAEVIVNTEGGEQTIEIIMTEDEEVVE